MSKTAEIRQNLLGCLEIALFMRRGAERFSSDISMMKKSFIVPALSLPLTCAIVLAAHPHDTSGVITNILITIYSLRLIIYLPCFLGLVYLMAKNLDKVENFQRFATANNWLMLPSVVLMIIPVIGMLTGHYNWADIQPLLMIVTLYSCACVAFMATHVMRIPWELASFVAICGLAIHQTSLDMVRWMTISTLELMS